MTIREQLERRVGEIVRRVIAELPPDLRTLAERVPVFCEWELAEHWLEEGVADDSMGLFSGPALNEPTDPDCLESPSITFCCATICGLSVSAFLVNSRLPCLESA